MPLAVDTAVEPLSDAAILAARLVAISVPMHTALRLGVQVAERVRVLHPAAHICFYGHYAWLNSEHLLEVCADSVIGGEYERALCELARALDADCVDTVQGVTTSDTASAPLLERIAFATPERGSLPPLDKYARLESPGVMKLAGYVEASRGCLHTCQHCPITPVYNGRFFVVPAPVVLEDIRTQVHMGARHITFGDPDFLNGPGHSMKIVKAMHAEFPDLTFDATIKIEHILERRTLFPELRELGCAFIVSAVESLSETVLTHLKKGHSKADVIEALAILKAAGIPMRPSLLPFTPWATLDDYLELLEFFEDQRMLEHVDPVHFSIRLLVPPDSALLADLTADGYLGPLNRASFTYEWTHPDQRMDSLQRQVARLAEEAEQERRDVVETFYAIKELAYEMRGARQRTVRRYVPDAAARPPRLTEGWFC